MISPHDLIDLCEVFALLTVELDDFFFLFDPVGFRGYSKPCSVVGRHIPLFRCERAMGRRVRGIVLAIAKAQRMVHEQRKYDSVSRVAQAFSGW